MTNSDLNKDTRWIEKNYPSFFCDISNYTSIDVPWKEKYFWSVNEIKDKPKCPICGNELKFLSIKKGYTKFCSRKCTAIGTIDKKKNTCIQKYGVDNPMKSEMIKDKFDKLITEKYGVSNISKLLDTKDKKKNTMLLNYGVEYNSQRDEVKSLLSEKMVQKSSEMNYKRSLQIFENLNKKIEMFDIKLVSVKSSNYQFECFNCGEFFAIHKNTLNDRIRNQNTICTICNKIDNTSNSQEIILDFIKSIYNGPIKSNDRHLGFELDIYLPELKIAFEYNGVYWHSDEFKDKKYHFNKTKMCSENGIKLIHIWEDFFISKRNIVLSRISNLLGNSKRVHGRNCKVSFISNDEYGKFIEENHLQGYVVSKYRIGIYYNNDLYGVMSFGGLRKALGQKSESGTYELLRFCNKNGYTIVGGASKMLNFFIKNICPNKIISYADKSWSSGSIYYRLGFRFDSETAPNYFYIKNGVRYNRFSFRKDILVRNGESISLSESEIMRKNKYYKIYDSGNYKFIWENKNPIK